MVKVYKYKLQPDLEQSLALERTLNACGDIGNLRLERKVDRTTAFAEMGDFTELAEQIRDAGWNQFLSPVRCKGEEAGSRVVEMGCQYTGLESPVSGTVANKQLSQRSHECEECGLVLRRDTAAAEVILGRMVPSGENVR